MVLTFAASERASTISTFRVNPQSLSFYRPSAQKSFPLPGQVDYSALHKASALAEFGLDLSTTTGSRNLISSYYSVTLSKKRRRLAKTILNMPCWNSLNFH